MPGFFGAEAHHNNWERSPATTIDADEQKQQPATPETPSWSDPLTATDPGDAQVGLREDSEAVVVPPVGRYPTRQRRPPERYEPSYISGEERGIAWLHLGIVSS